MNDDQFGQVLERVRTNKSEATAEQYLPKIRDFREWLDGKPFEGADVIDVEDWLAELDDRYSNASSVGKGSAALVAAYSELNKLIDAERIDADGWVRETPPERATYSPEDTSTAKARESKQDLHFLEPEQVDSMARNAERVRGELIIRTLFQTGARVTELTEIKLSDIDRESRSIHIRGKGRKNRTVYYQPSLDLLMDVWIDERRPAVFYAEESNYLFPTSHSEKITRLTVGEIVKGAAERAGLQEIYTTSVEGDELHSITPHVCRHSFAMAALSNDWDVYTLSQALGHESTEITTSIYLHDSEKEMRKAFKGRGVST